MKIRNGWVGNSSSSSFIIQLEEEIKYENIYNWLKEHIKQPDIFTNLKEQEVLDKLYNSFEEYTPEKYYSEKEKWENYNLLTNLRDNTIFTTKIIDNINRDNIKYVKEFNDKYIHFKRIRKRQIKIFNKWYKDFKLYNLELDKQKYFSKYTYFFKIGDESSVGDIFLLTKEKLDDRSVWKDNFYHYPLDDLYRIGYFNLNNIKILDHW